jgi:hypothetical protein
MREHQIPPVTVVSHRPMALGNIILDSSCRVPNHYMLGKGVPSFPKYNVKKHTPSFPKYKVMV